MRCCGCLSQARHNVCPGVGSAPSAHSPSLKRTPRSPDETTQNAKRLRLGAATPRPGPDEGVNRLRLRAQELARSKSLLEPLPSSTAVCVPSDMAFVDLGEAVEQSWVAFFVGIGEVARCQPEAALRILDSDAIAKGAMTGRVLPQLAEGSPARATVAADATLADSYRGVSFRASPDDLRAVLGSILSESVVDRGRIARPVASMYFAHAKSGSPQERVLRAAAACVLRIIAHHPAYASLRTALQDSDKASSACHATLALLRDNCPLDLQRLPTLFMNDEALKRFVRQPDDFDDETVALYWAYTAAFPVRLRVSPGTLQEEFYELGDDRALARVRGVLQRLQRMLG